MKKTLLLIISLAFSLLGLALPMNKAYILWYDSPAPNQGKDFKKIVARGFPYDADWERWSLALGNGYMGACVFGRTDTERIQLSEKTLGNGSCYKNGGFTNFAEFYLDFSHNKVENYKRALRLNDAISTVDYDYKGVHYSREYFANYPSNVIVVKIKANKPQQLSFKVRSEIPYLKTGRTTDNRTGQITTEENTTTLSGNMEFFNVDYEAQIKVVNFGGQLNKTKNDELTILQADSAVLYITAGTSYALNQDLFVLPPLQKCQGKANIHPHKAVSKRIAKAEKKGFSKLKAEHIKDYQQLFNRVTLDFSSEIPQIPTDKLVHEYQNGKYNTYLDELYFQFGRYLMIASSRPGSLPPNLQGAWTQYDYSPWSGGYWHNVNIQMNYWPVFNTNLAELFKPFADYNEAYRKAAELKADEYVKKNNPEQYSTIPGENGWTIGCGASAYGITAPGGHSGPGTGGFTTKLYWDYYDFTRDNKILKEHTYPALEGMAKFLSKTLKDDGKGHLLADPSFSPEQRHNEEYFKAKGCTFDQGMIWENFNDLLNAALLLNKKSPFIDEVKEKIQKLDPIQIGADGQIKEFREENKYSDIGDPHHRHISHLCTLYPGTLVNNNTQEWLEAAKISMEKRGFDPGYFAGWPMAHRMNGFARLKNGEYAYLFYQILLTKGIFENLWGKCPPFQVDSNFGGTAGVAEMLLQSHEGYIYPLPALPSVWKDGSVEGLVARGNFVVDMKWSNKQLTSLKVTSRKGGTCKIYLPSSSVQVKNKKNKFIEYKKVDEHVVVFETQKDNIYTVNLKK